MYNEYTPDYITELKPNMRRIIILCCLFIVVNNAIGQVVQNGTVKEYNERLEKTPLNQVEITISNAASTISDDEGNFTLQFRTLKPGDKVNVRRIEKLGYEIFNKEALEQWYVARSNTPFVIIMCKSEKFKRIRDNYTRVSSDSYEKQLKKEEARLAAERKAGKLKEAEYEAALKKLNDEYDRQLENLDNYVDKFARIDLSELSAVEAEIIELVQGGNIDEAINRYDQQLLEEKYKEQVANIRRSQAGIDALTNVRAQSQISRDSLFASILRKNEMRKLAGGRENFEKIGKSLKEIALADTTYYDAVYEYAFFSNSQNKFDEALRFYSTCLNITTRNTDKCKILRQIGEIQLELNHFNQAENYLIRSLEIAQLLWKQDSVNYQSYMAETQNSMAHLYAKMREFSKAEEYYIKAMDNYTSLSGVQDNMLEYLAELQADLCQMYLDMREFGKTGDMINRAERNTQTLYNVLPEQFRPLMARVKCAAGRNHKYFMRYNAAEESYKMALEQYSVLFKNNPSAYRPELADIYDKMSDLYTLMHKFEESKYYAALAVSQYDTLSMNITEAYLPDISNIKSEQAHLCQIMRRYADMKRYTEDGYEVIAKLYSNYPNVYRYNYCNLTMNMGICHAMHNNMQDAEKYFLEAKSLAETLCSDYPDTYLPTYLSTTKNLGSLYSMWHQYDKDSLYTTLAMNTCEKLYEGNPEVYKQEYASMLYNFAVYHIKVEKIHEADSIARQAESIYRELTKAYPEIFTENYQRLARILGIIQGNLKNIEEEQRYKLLAYEIASSLFQANSQVYLDVYTQSLNDIAFYYQTNDDLDKSVEYYQDGLEKVRALYRDNSKAFAPKMMEMLMSYALLCRQTKDYKKAWESQKEATKICESLYQADSLRFSFEMGLCYSMEGSIQYHGFKDEESAEKSHIQSLPLLTAVLSTHKAAKGQIISNRKVLADIYMHREDYEKAYEQINALLELSQGDEDIIKKKQQLDELLNISHQ